MCEILQRHWLNIHRNTGLTRFEQGEKGKQSQIHNEHGSKSVTASIFLFGFCFIAKVFFGEVIRRNKLIWAVWPSQQHQQQRQPKLAR